MNKQLFCTSIIFSLVLLSSTSILPMSAFIRGGTRAFIDSVGSSVKYGLIATPPLVGLTSFVISCPFTDPKMRVASQKTNYIPCSPSLPLEEKLELLSPTAINIFIADNALLRGMKFMGFSTRALSFMPHVGRSITISQEAYEKNLSNQQVNNQSVQNQRDEYKFRMAIASRAASQRIPEKILQTYFCLPLYLAAGLAFMRGGVVRSGMIKPFKGAIARNLAKITGGLGICGVTFGTLLHQGLTLTRRVDASIPDDLNVLRAGVRVIEDDIEVALAEGNPELQDTKLVQLVRASAMARLAYYKDRIAALEGNVER